MRDKPHEMKVMVPSLPTADELLPYLRRIDLSGQYTNDGPLVRELEAELGGVCVTNCTLGLEIAASLLFQQGTEVRIPAFTFPATVLAATRAGLIPVLCDVREGDWTMDADADEPAIPVCTFGVPARGGRLIDAAGAMGNQDHGTRVFSLHATKSLPAGEGGLICSDDEDFLESVRAARNFGFVDGTVHQYFGTNAKMSEYHAAVALASMATFDARCASRMALEARYRRNLAGMVEMQDRPPGNYMIFPVLLPNRDEAEFRLTRAGIQTRRWYLPSMERHPSFVGCKQERLPMTKRLNDELLCLPFHGFMDAQDVDRVCDVLASSLSKAA